MAIESYGPERLAENVLRTYDEIRSVLAAQTKKFSVLIDAGSGGRSPRYYHGVFMAFYELMFKDRLRIRSYSDAASALVAVGSSVMGVPAGGGDWVSSNKRTTIDALKGVLRPCFEGPIEGEDLGRFGYAYQLETLLGNALIEQAQFECKQGLYTLDNSRSFDEASFAKICRSLTAMANSGPNVAGYVLLGVADSDADANRIANRDGTTASLYRGFRIVGIDREATIERTDLNDYWHWIVQKFGSSSLPPALAAQVGSSSRLIAYQGKAVGLLQVTGGAEPYFFNGEIVERVGSETKSVPQNQYMRIYARFATG